MKKFSFEPNLKAAIGLIQLLLNPNQYFDTEIRIDPAAPVRPNKPDFGLDESWWDEDNSTL